MSLVAWWAERSAWPTPGEQKGGPQICGECRAHGEKGFSLAISSRACPTVFGQTPFTDATCRTPCWRETGAQEPQPGAQEQHPSEQTAASIAHPAPPQSQERAGGGAGNEAPTARGLSAVSGRERIVAVVRSVSAAAMAAWLHACGNRARRLERERETGRASIQDRPSGSRKCKERQRPTGDPTHHSGSPVSVSPLHTHSLHSFSSSSPISLTLFFASSSNCTSYPPSSSTTPVRSPPAPPTPHRPAHPPTHSPPPHSTHHGRRQDPPPPYIAGTRPAPEC